MRKQKQIPRPKGAGCPTDYNWKAPKWLISEAIAAMDRNIVEINARKKTDERDKLVKANMKLKRRLQTLYKQYG